MVMDEVMMECPPGNHFGVLFIAAGGGERIKLK